MQNLFNSSKPNIKKRFMDDKIEKTIRRISYKILCKKTEEERGIENV